MASQIQPNLTPPSSEPWGAAQSSLSAAPQESHEIQLRYKLAPSTFKTLCTISPAPSRQDILKKACFATEFRSFPIKKGQGGFLRGINDHTGIPYPIAESVSQPWHKVFLLVQIELLRTGWPNKLSADTRKELHQELPRVYKLLDSVLRCLVDILGERRDGMGVRTALDVLRSVKAVVWEGSENQLLQVDGIGLASKDRLVQAGIKTIKRLAQLEFYHIERLLSRNPPFGQTMRHKLAGFPLLTLDFEILGQHNPPETPASSSLPTRATNSVVNDHEGQSAASLWIARAVLGFGNEKGPSWKGSNPWLTLVIEGQDGRLVWFWRGSSKRLVEGKEMVIGLDARKGEELKVTLACEEIVGTCHQ